MRTLVLGADEAPEDERRGDECEADQDYKQLPGTKDKTLVC